jgi:hypothetical protein
MILALIGESFRYGKQGSRQRGDIKKSIETQMNAAKTHMKFKEIIEKKYNIKISIHLHVYSIELNKLLIDLYKPEKKLIIQL